jgi:hypothetical protein
LSLRAKNFFGLVTLRGIVAATAGAQSGRAWHGGIRAKAPQIGRNLAKMNFYIQGK